MHYPANKPESSYLPKGVMGLLQGKFNQPLVEWALDPHNLSFENLDDETLLGDYTRKTGDTRINSAYRSRENLPRNAPDRPQTDTEIARVVAHEQVGLGGVGDILDVLRKRSTKENYDTKIMRRIERGLGKGIKEDYNLPFKTLEKRWKEDEEDRERYRAIDDELFKSTMSLMLSPTKEGKTMAYGDTYLSGDEYASRMIEKELWPGKYDWVLNRLKRDDLLDEDKKSEIKKAVRLANKGAGRLMSVINDEWALEDTMEANVEANVIPELLKMLPNKK